MSKKVRLSLGPLCEGAPPAGGGGENCTAIRNISGYGKVLSLRPYGAPPSQRGGFDTLGFPLGGRLYLHQFLQYRILHDHPGGGQAEHLSVPHGIPVPDALPHKDALCRRKPSAAAFIRRDVQPADQP